MNQFQEPKPISKWNIVLWGIILAVVVDAFVYYSAPATQPASFSQYIIGPILIAGVAYAVFQRSFLRANRNETLQSQNPTDPAFQIQDKPRINAAIFIKIGGCLVAGLLFFIAGKGIYQGHIDPFSKHMHTDVYESKESGRFWLNVSFYAVLGTYVIFRTFKPSKK